MTERPRGERDAGGDLLRLLTSGGRNGKKTMERKKNPLRGGGGGGAHAKRKSLLKENIHRMCHQKPGTRNKRNFRLPRTKKEKGQGGTIGKSFREGAGHQGEKSQINLKEAGGGKGIEEKRANWGWEPKSSRERTRGRKPMGGLSR